MHRQHQNTRESKALIPVVTLVNDQPRAMSTDVAAYFGKRHDNVIRDIRQIINECPDDYRALNFEETLISVPGPNGATRQETAYSLTRDGFTLLAMGFTGSQALKWKIKYIEAFNRMEAALTKGNAALAAQLTSIEARLNHLEKAPASPAVAYKAVDSNALRYEKVIEILSKGRPYQENHLYEEMRYWLSSRRALYRILGELEISGIIQRRKSSNVTYWGLV